MEKSQVNYIHSLHLQKIHFFVRDCSKLKDHENLKVLMTQIIYEFIIINIFIIMKRLYAKALLRRHYYYATTLIVKYHCVKSVQIRSSFWSVFSHIRSEYGQLSLRILSECGKIRTGKNSVFGHFSSSGMQLIIGLIPIFSILITF